MNYCLLTCSWLLYNFMQSRMKTVWLVFTGRRFHWCPLVCVRVCVCAHGGQNQLKWAGQGLFPLKCSQDADSNRPVISFPLAIRGNLRRRGYSSLTATHKQNTHTHSHRYIYAKPHTFLHQNSTPEHKYMLVDTHLMTLFQLQAVLNTHAHLPSHSCLEWHNDSESATVDGVLTESNLRAGWADETRVTERPRRVSVIKQKDSAESGDGSCGVTSLRETDRERKTGKDWCKSLMSSLWHSRSVLDPQLSPAALSKCFKSSSIGQRGEIHFCLLISWNKWSEP